MSLQIWLPLNGNLQQQGLSSVNATMMGTGITYSAGKIGQAATFPNNCNSCIYLPSLRLQTGTYAAWIKVIGAGRTARQCIISEGRDSSNDGVEIYTNQAGTSLNFKAHEKIITTTISLNQWYHVAGTFGNGEIKLYINGTLVGSNTYTADMSYQYASNLVLGKMSYSYTNTSNYFAFNGQLNDVRIYNHALSAKEVEEIAKGLILHYKLDQPANINYNLYTGSKNFTGSWVNGSAWTTSLETYNGFTVKQKSTVWGGLAQNITAVNGDIFTISFWGKVDSGGNILSIHRSSLGNVTTGLTILDGNFSTSTNWINATDDGTQWKRYWATLQITSSDITYLQWRIENSIANKNLYIAGLTLEKGYGTKNWSLSASEAGTTNIIYDSSGYNNNGTIIGSLQTITSNPRYNCAARLESSSPTTNNNTGLSYIQTPLQISTPTQMTVCWWAKPENGYNNSVGHGAWCTSANNEAPLDYNSTAFHHRDNKFDICLNSAPTTSLSLSFNNYTKNEWHYYSVVYDGKDAILYKDGIETNRSSISSTIAPLKSFTNLYIGFSKAGGVWRKTLGAYSDFRIYATALTAEQIKELYNTSATIDNAGNIHTRELVEI